MPRPSSAGHAVEITSDFGVISGFDPMRTSVVATQTLRRRMDAVRRGDGPVGRCTLRAAPLV
jgi:hypothetical protein